MKYFMFHESNPLVFWFLQLSASLSFSFKSLPFQAKSSIESTKPFPHELLLFWIFV